MNSGGQSGCAGGKPVRRWAKEAVKLGDVARLVMDRHISPRQSRFGDIAEVWAEILPDELCRHCEVVDASGGQLKVRVDSPSYMYELQLCSSELLEEMRRRRPRARLTRIKFVAGTI